jgi:hypothetical protein
VVASVFRHDRAFWSSNHEVLRANFVQEAHLTDF